jgi:hypothetical protein
MTRRQRIVMMVFMLAVATVASFTLARRYRARAIAPIARSALRAPSPARWNGAASTEPNVADGESEGPLRPASPPSRPQYKPRPPGEWDGMLIDLAVRPPCLEIACGMARACIEGLCSACQRDDQCLDGEGCVLDHCVKAERIQCRSTRQCGSNAFCVLTGYSSDVRGNADMSARCISRASGGSKARTVPLPASEGDLGARADKGFDDEIRRAQAASVSN